jgi:epoxyqueuosine reductase
MGIEASVKAKAVELGFLTAGIASLEDNAHGDHLDRWLAQGYAGTMRYLHRQAKKRKHPAEIVADAKVAVVVLDNYLPPVDDPPAGRSAKIAKYARGRDYHLDCGARLDRLADYLRELGATVARPFVDAGPVPERELAVRAGLGWVGKNTMVIRPGVGSFFFIGSIFTDLALMPDPPFESDHCGTCTRCLDACPTQAFVGPNLLDATRCISYLTIEYRGELPADLASEFDGWAFGCDICNDVCPWNVRFAVATSNTAYHDRNAIDLTRSDTFETMTESEFDRRFADTPLERPGLAGMRRNLTAALASLHPSP